MIYKNNKEIRNIYFGNKKARRVWIDNTLVHIGQNSSEELEWSAYPSSTGYVSVSNIFNRCDRLVIKAWDDSALYGGIFEFTSYGAKSETYSTSGYPLQLMVDVTTSYIRVLYQDAPATFFKEGLIEYASGYKTVWTPIPVP